jgi:Ran GTPase-activating protein (RanGAP) involved in mRNA processing and transport
VLHKQRQAADQKAAIEALRAEAERAGWEQMNGQSDKWFDGKTHRDGSTITNLLRELEAGARALEAQRCGMKANFDRLSMAAKRKLVPHICASVQAYVDVYATLSSAHMPVLASLAAVSRKINRIAAREGRNRMQQQPPPALLAADDGQPPITPVCDARFLALLYKDAATLDSGYMEPVLSVLVSRLQAVSNHEVGIEVMRGALKAAERCCEKTMEENGGDYSLLCDIVRSALIFGAGDAPSGDALRALQACVELLATDGGLDLQLTDGGESVRLDVLRVKNRLDPDFDAECASGGYRDVLLNCRLCGGHVGQCEYHIFELQLHLRSFAALKGASHAVYNSTRTLRMFDPDAIRFAGLCSPDIFEPIASGVLRHIDFSKTDGRVALKHAAGFAAALGSEQCLVQALNFKECAIANDDSGSAPSFARLCDGLAANSSIKLLDLTKTGIEREAFAVLAPALARMPLLAVLKFYGCDIGIACPQLLAEVLPQMAALTELCLYRTGMGAAGLATLAGALPRARALVNLGIGWNAICGEKETEDQFVDSGNGLRDLAGARALGAALPSTKLATLDVIGNALGPHGCGQLLSKGFSQLVTLNLDKNKLGVAGAHALAKALPRAEALQRLNLARNDLCGNSSVADERDSSGLHAVFSALEDLQCISTVALNLNRLRDEDASALAAALLKVPSITSCCLMQNEFTWTGTTAIDNVLRGAQRTVSLIRVGLQGVQESHRFDENPPQYAVFVANDLRVCTKLERLDLAGNHFGKEGGDKLLMSALAVAPSLSKLRISGNSFDDEAEAALHELCAALSIEIVDYDPCSASVTLCGSW